ncbi:hypothetical protein BH10CYA1_BH10CYA1_37640 [soil metagenome]
MQTNTNPKLMMVLLVVAMVCGTFFSIIWPIVWPAIHSNLVLGSRQPPAEATGEERAEFYRVGMQKAIDNNLGADTVARLASNYADSLGFDRRNYPAAKKAYAKLNELCNFKGSSGLVRTYQADSQIANGYIDHYNYLLNRSKPPDPQIALDAQKHQIEAARELGYTNDVNDVQRQERTLEAIATFYCDNGKYAEALKYIDQAIDVIEKSKAASVNHALALVIKARVLSGLGKTDEADKLFKDAVKSTDTAYGGGSDASEWCLHTYSAALIADGQLERGNKIRQQQDDLTVW